MAKARTELQEASVGEQAEVAAALNKTSEEMGQVMEAAIVKVDFQLTADTSPPADTVADRAPAPDTALPTSEATKDPAAPADAPAATTDAEMPDAGVATAQKDAAEEAPVLDARPAEPAKLGLGAPQGTIATLQANVPLKVAGTPADKGAELSPAPADKLADAVNDGATAPPPAAATTEAV